MVVFSTRRLSFLSWTLLTGMVLCVLSGLALAAGDPLGAAQTSVDGGIGLVTTYGPVLGSMYLLYQLASRLVGKYASSSWLAKGKRLAIITGVLGVAGATLQAEASGGSWNVIALAAIAAAFKLLTPTVSPAIDPTPSSTSAPTVPLARALARAESAVTRGAVLLVLWIGCSVIGVSGCSGTARNTSEEVGLNCTTTARKDLVEALVPTAVSALGKIADPSGKITTEALRALFSGASLQREEGIIVACVEARAIELIAPLLGISSTGSFASSTETKRLDGVALRQAFSAQFPGVLFKTSP